MVFHDKMIEVKSPREGKRDKDRVSGMSKSHLHASPAKNGNGASYTWGGNETTVVPEAVNDFRPHDPAQVKERMMPHVGSPKTRATLVRSQPSFKYSDKEFPALSNSPIPPKSPQRVAQAAMWAKEAKFDIELVNSNIHIHWPEEEHKSSSATAAKRNKSAQDIDTHGQARFKGIRWPQLHDSIPDEFKPGFEEDKEDSRALLKTTCKRARKHPTSPVSPAPQGTGFRSPQLDYSIPDEFKPGFEEDKVESRTILHTTSKRTRNVKHPVAPVQVTAK